MNIRKRLIALGGGMLLGVAGVAHAETAGNADVQAELATLKARIAELETRNDSNWLNERRAEEVKSLVREVLADADTRASLLQGGATAGHDGRRFFLASEDGSHLMNISGQIQTRYVLNYQRGDAAVIDVFDPNVGALVPTAVSAPDRWQGGFELRRAKVMIDGHISSPRFTYALRAATHSGQVTDIELATIGYEILDGVWLRVGRDKAPFLREELVESSHQLAVERSLVNQYFSTRYVEGVYLETVLQDMVRLAGSINNGSNSAGSNFATAGAFTAGATDFAATVRADVRLMGGWEQWNDFTSWHGAEQSLIVGAALHYEVAETGDPNPNNAFLAWTIDGSFKTGGLGVYGALIGQHDTDAGGTGFEKREQYGAVVQAGYLVTDRIEPFVRYEFLRVEDLGGNVDRIHIGTIGANYYINGHATKLTVDVVWAFDPVPAGVASETHGILADTTSDDQIAHAVREERSKAYAENANAPDIPPPPVGLLRR